MAGRPYDNALRREQAGLTKRRILEAVRDLLIQSPTALSIPEISARAGVSEPTIYRHFPNRDALLEAASAVVSAELGAPPFPRQANEIPVAAIAVCRGSRARCWTRSRRRGRASSTTRRSSEAAGGVPPPRRNGGRDVSNLRFDPPGPGSWMLDLAHCERPRSQYMHALFAHEYSNGMRAIGYVRESIEKQADLGVSVDAQAAKIRAMAVVRGADMADVIIDVGESAKSLKRPGMARLLAFVVHLAHQTLAA